MKEIYEAIKLNEKDLNFVFESSRAKFKLMKTALGDDPFEIIEFSLYRIEALHLQLMKLITLMEEEQK